MKKLFLGLALLLVSVTVTAQGINFQQLTLEQAIEKSKAENKYIFLDIYTDWCAPCKMMDQDVFTLKEVGDYFNAKFISVKFNAEKGDEGPVVAKKFGVKAYPTFIILDNEGNLVHMFAGGTLGVGFINKVEESFNSDIAFGNLQKLYNSGARDLKTVAKYLKSLQGTFTTDVSPLIEEFYQSLSPEELICEDALFIFDDYAQLGSTKSNFFAENFEKFRSAVGREKADLMMKKKFEAYYAGILGRQRVANASDIDEKNSLLAGYNLQKSDILSLYQSSLKVYLTKVGASELFAKIVDQAKNFENNEIDRFMYFTIAPLVDVWEDGQADQLAQMIHDDRTRDAVVKGLERMKRNKSESQK